MDLGGGPSDIMSGLGLQLHCCCNICHTKHTRNDCDKNGVIAHNYEQKIEF